jgi:hypothetical protein
LRKKKLLSILNIKTKKPIASFLLDFKSVVLIKGDAFLLKIISSL